MLAPEARELIFPDAHLGTGEDAPEGEDVHHRRTRLLRRAKVEARGATLGKMAIARAEGIRQPGEAKAAKGVEVLQRWQQTRDDEAGRLVAATRLRKAVVDPCGGLEGERVQGGIIVGGIIEG